MLNGASPPRGCPQGLLLGEVGLQSLLDSVTGHLFASVSLVLLSPNLPKMIGGAGQKKSQL
jgi:hypothetical protein